MVHGQNSRQSDRQPVEHQLRVCYKDSTYTKHKQCYLILVNMEYINKTQLNSMFTNSSIIFVFLPLPLYFPAFFYGTAAKG